MVELQHIQDELEEVRKILPTKEQLQEFGSGPEGAAKARQAQLQLHKALLGRANQLTGQNRQLLARVLRGFARLLNP